jgi:CSLREA domain-containing protein
LTSFAPFRNIALSISFATRQRAPAKIVFRSTSIKLPMKIQCPRVIVTLLLLLFSAAVCVQATAAATVRYVSTTGSNTDNDCTDANNACAGIAYAISQSDPGDTVQVAAGTYTEHGITVNKNLTINGHAASDTIVQAAPTQGTATDRVFNISTGTVTISGLTVSNGSAASGGGIFNSGGLTLNNSVVSGNTSAADGGGIRTDGSLTLNNCTVAGNHAVNIGGGLFSNGPPVTISNTTVSGNSAAGGGGLGTNGFGTINIRNSTFTANSAGGGGGIANSLITPLNLTSSIVAHNTANAPAAGPDIQGPITSGDYNLIESTGGINNGFIPGTHNITGQDPKLGALAYYGGPTPTHVLLTGSPAVDQGKNFSGATTDQRGAGFARIVDDGAINNASGGDASDIGAFERQASDVDPTLIVTTTADSNANPTCDPANPCSLRDAITAANASGPDDVIYFAVIGAITLNANGSLPTITSNMKILGPGAKALTVQRDFALPPTTFFRIFRIQSGAVTISGLTITNGADDPGGAILSVGDLTLNGCIVTGNTDNGSDGGGGIRAVGPLTINGSVITDNHAPGSGGGIYGGFPLTVTDSTIGNNTAVAGAGLWRQGGTANLTNCTISGNTADQAGGGMDNISSATTFTNCTISGNTANGMGEGGGIFNVSSSTSTSLTLVSCTLTKNTGSGASAIWTQSFNLSLVATTHLQDTLVADNTGPNFVTTDMNASLVSDGYNLDSDGTSGFSNNDIVGTAGSPINAMLGPLQDNGGPTFTQALLPGSPAIDKGKNINSLATDQRGNGFVRTFDNLSIANANGGDGTDIGAFEVQNTPPTITAATISQRQGAGSSNSEIATVSDNEDPPTALTVTVNGVSSATVNGVTVSHITIDNSGNVKADAVASCSATNASFTLRVTDTGGLYTEATLSVTVTANAAPVITLKPSPVLNPANHKYSTFTISSLVASATDDSNGNVLSHVVITSVSSDEPEDAKGNGDGATKKDIVIANGCGSVQLRAERADAGNGRVYRVNLKVTDSCGASGTATAKVLVPRSGPAVDDGPGAGYTVVGPCGP